MEGLSSSKKTKLIICLLAAAVFCILIFYYGQYGEHMMTIVSEPESFQRWLDQFGMWDEMMFIILRAMQTMIKFIPAEPVEIASGYLWGAVKGTVLCLIGNLIGTLVILALTQKFGEKIVDAFVSKKNQDFIYSLKESEKTYFLVFLIYFIPGMPKDIFIYMAGLFKIKVIPYLLISLTARIPSVASSVICGAFAFQKQYTLSLLILGVSLFVTGIFALIGHVWLKKKQKTPVL